jgi:hypothetical protein
MCARAVHIAHTPFNFSTRKYSSSIMKFSVTMTSLPSFDDSLDGVRWCTLVATPLMVHAVGVHVPDDIPCLLDRKRIFNDRRPVVPRRLPTAAYISFTCTLVQRYSLSPPLSGRAASRAAGVTSVCRRNANSSSRRCRLGMMPH